MRLSQDEPSVQRPLLAFCLITAQVTDVTAIHIWPFLGRSSALRGRSRPPSIRTHNEIRRQRVSPWGSLSAAELALLQTVFWSAGASRHALSSRMDYSRSRANSLVAGLLDQGLLEE